jgi:hypothetical protein
VGHFSTYQSARQYLFLMLQPYSLWHNRSAVPGHQGHRQCVNGHVAFQENTTHPWQRGLLTPELVVLTPALSFRGPSVVCSFLPTWALSSLLIQRIQDCLYCLFKVPGVQLLHMQSASMKVNPHSQCTEGFGTRILLLGGMGTELRPVCCVAFCHLPKLRKPVPTANGAMIAKDVMLLLLCSSAFGSRDI